VLQALHQLSGGEVRANLVLGARGEFLDGLLTCDKGLTNDRVSSTLRTVKRAEENL
jgi:hypothetical protein